MRSLRGRKARRYPGGVEDARAIIRYDPLTGEMQTRDKYNIRARRGKDGYNIIRLPLGLEYTERGKRMMGEFRCDHLAWYIVMGYWPVGWIEHVNDLQSDDSLDNLIFLDMEGIRWWYGPDTAGGAPMLVQVQSIYKADGYEGPLLYEQRMENGKMRWLPAVADAYRISTAGGTDLADDDTYHKGEFGKDWGLIPEQGPSE